MKRLFDKYGLTKTLLVAGIISAAIGWVYYSWYYQSLPQAAIYVLNSVPNPVARERILVFSPHPDDETLAAGGYMATAEQNGASVWIALVTNGDRRGLEYARYSEFIKATGTLGVPESHLFFLGYPDGGLSKIPQASFEKNLQNIVNEVNPNIIIAPDPKDYNKDHSIIGQTIEKITAGKGKTIYYYIIHYPHFPLPQSYDPNSYILPPLRLMGSREDWRKFIVSPYTEAIKKNAILEYKSQLANPFLQSLLLGMIRENELFVVVNRG